MGGLVVGTVVEDLALVAVVGLPTLALERHPVTVAPVLTATDVLWNTVKRRSLEAVGTLLKSSNHPKCELNSHFG